MKVYVINLDTATDRMAFTDQQLQKLNVTYERFPAIYGKALSQYDLKNLHAPFRQWVIMGCTLSLSEIGCSASHLAIYEKMIRENLSMACIMEDDLCLLPTFTKWLNHLERKVDVTKSAAYILHAGGDDVTSSFEIIKDANLTGGCIYVITQPFAKAMLRKNKPIITPIDHWKRWRICGEIYKCTPRAGGHWARKTFGSMMDDEIKHESRKRDIKSKVYRFLWRYTARLIDRSVLSLCIYLRK